MATGRVAGSAPNMHEPLAAPIAHLKAKESQNAAQPSWSSRGTLDLLASSTQLAGSFIWTVNVSGLTGQGYNELDLVDVERTSGPTSRPAISRRGFDSLPSVFRGMRQLQ